MIGQFYYSTSADIHSVLFGGDYPLFLKIEEDLYIMVYSYYIRNAFSDESFTTGFNEEVKRFIASPTKENARPLKKHHRLSYYSLNVDDIHLLPPFFNKELYTRALEEMYQASKLIEMAHEINCSIEERALSFQDFSQRYRHHPISSNISYIPTSSPL